MTSEALKPCPCGSKAELHEDISMSGKGRFWVQSEAGWVGPVKSEPDDAIDFWNTRIDTLPATADREAIAVKPLEWDGDFAYTRLGVHYSIERGNEHALILKVHIGSSSLGIAVSYDIPSIEAAAQADYERRILSTLSPKVTEISGGSDNIGNSDPVSGWRSMESAPKDGSYVILARLYELDGEPMSVVTFGHWTEGYGDGPDEMGMNSGWEDHHYSEFDPGRDFGNPAYMRKPLQPTHWMPLPAAPDATKQPEQDTVRVEDWGPEHCNHCKYSESLCGECYQKMIGAKHE